MMFRIVGAMLIVAGSAVLGWKATLLHRKEVAALKQLISALDYMECELQYRLTPLPILCCKTGDNCTGVVSNVFRELANELDNQIAPDAKLCMESALTKVKDLPATARQKMESLGMVLGRFDIEGQISDLHSVRSECIRLLERFTCDEDTRLRNYRTMAICAGIAIAIVLF